MAKFTVLGSFADDELSRVVPSEYRGLVRFLTRPGTSYTVAQFRHDRADVIDSATVHRALEQIGDNVQILAVGGNFTTEALTLLESRRAIVARLGEFHWTDDAWHSLPQ